MAARPTTSTSFWCPTSRNTEWTAAPSPTGQMCKATTGSARFWFGYYAVRCTVGPVYGTGPVIVSDDGQAAIGPPFASDLDAGLAVGVRPSSVTSESSDDASTLSSVSTSSLSPTSVSSHSSDSCSVAWSEADVEVLPDVPSESDEWELAPDDDDETGEGKVAQRLPK